VTLEVRRATADEVRPLRLGVLRPNAPLVPAAYDELPDTVHVAALDDGQVVGCATVFPEPYGDEPTAWRLRGMAVDPAYQGTGVGRLVLAEAVAAAREAGARLLWANGRTSALGFYQKQGWEPVGEEFSYGPADLPHFVMVYRCPV
jgi:GNAT superfamily N-acetyltransferase